MHENLRARLSADWRSAMATARNRGVGQTAMRTLERLAREDVEDTVATLRETNSSAVTAAWLEWHHRYVVERLSAWMDERPWLALSEDVRRAIERKRVRDAVLRVRKSDMADRLISVLEATACGMLPAEVAIESLYPPQRRKGQSVSALRALVDELHKLGVVRVVRGGQAGVYWALCGVMRPEDRAHLAFA